MAATTAAPAATAGSHATDDTPAFVSPLYTEQAHRWRLCRDVMLGTEAMRAHNAIYLVQGAAETDGEFALRTQRAECFPMFKETVKGMTGLVFRKDPVLQDDVPDPLVELSENIDGAGTHLAVFLRQVFEDAMQTGHAGILVDMPQSPLTDRALTIAEEQALGMRAYWLHIAAEQIVNWRTDVIHGVTVLTLLVIRERHIAPMGAFMTAMVTRYRVFRRDLVTGVVSFSVYEFGPDNDQEMREAQTGILRNVQAIPFAVVYAGQRRGPLTSFPPLVDLAYTNVAHMQVLADHRTSLHMAGVPIFVRIGMEETPGDPNRGIGDGFDATQLDATTPEGIAQIEAINGGGSVQVIGPNMGIDLPLGGNAKYVEHNGNALSASQAELTAIEKRAAAQGLSLLSPDNRAAETAEAKRLDRAQQDAALSRAARSMQDCTEQALEYTAQFLRLPSGGSCQFNTDFQDLVMDTALFSELSKSTLAGQIPLTTFWQLLMTGNILPDDFDPDSALVQLESQSSGITLGAGRTIASPGTAIPAPVAPSLQQSLPADATPEEPSLAVRSPTQGDTGATGDLAGDPALGGAGSLAPGSGVSSGGVG